MINITVYNSELAECLKKESVEELDKFIEKHSQLYEKKFVENWHNATEKVKQMTMYKLMTVCNLVPNKLRCKARRWLKKNVVAN